MPTSTDPLVFDDFADDALSVDTFKFKLKFIAHVGGDEVDITDSVGTVSFWFGEVATGVYGWSIDLSGINYDRYIYAVGNQVDVYRTITLPSSLGWTPTEDLWYSGFLMPGSVSVAYQSNNWSARVVDLVTFLSLQQSPVIAVGQINVATNGSVIADSEAAPEIVANQLEFIGEPNLGASMAVDGDKSSLWISTNAPATGSIASTFHNRIRVSEVYSLPNPSLTMKENQWIELCHNNSALGGQDTVCMMTRFGMIRLPISFGEPLEDSPTPEPRFAVVSYDNDSFAQIWGEAPRHCPHHEWKNASWESIWWDTEDARNFGFNLDGKGDYIALYGNDYGPGGRGSHEWITNLVVDGPKTQRYSVSSAGGGVVSRSAGNTKITVDLDEEWDEDELEGCFIDCNYGSATGHNHVRWITGNTASAASGAFYRTTLTLSQAWRAFNAPWDYQPEEGDTVRISGYPRSGRSAGAWPSGNVTEQSVLSSLRLSSYLPALGAAGWIEDDTPQIGYSGAHPNEETWSWLSVEPVDMVFYLSNSLVAGATTVNLQGTAGLTDTGSVFIGLDGPFAYTGKTSSTITLTSAWAGSTMPIGTQVYQSVDDAATTLWPVSEVALVRKQVPRLDDPSMYRVIKNLQVYGATDLSPLYPGEEDWKLDWTDLFRIDNNTHLTRLSWSVDTPIRYRHYLFCIKAMSDESQGRINEVELLMPNSVLGASLYNQSAVSFLTYILVAMGIDEDDITAVLLSPMQIGSFSTDTSGYLSVLSDLATRTGYIVICKPDSTVEIAYNPNWHPSGALVSITTLDQADIKSVSVEQRDDLSIAQVEVTVEDDGDIGIGVFPPVPRSNGTVYKEPTVFAARLAQADTVARWLLTEKTSSLITVKLVGPATWAIGGSQVVDVQWDEDFSVSGPDIQGRWIIRGTEHAISFGDSLSQPNWETTLLLQRKT